MAMAYNIMENEREGYTAIIRATGFYPCPTIPPLRRAQKVPLNVGAGHDQINCHINLPKEDIRNQKEFTFLSTNIEKHAKPNNTCCIDSEKALINNEHPHLKAIPISTLQWDDLEILDDYVKLGYLTKNNTHYHRTAQHGFPRLLIQIKDQQLKCLAQQTHPEVYQYVHSLPRHLQKYTDTINDIVVAQIQDNKPKKIGFEKILNPINDPIEPQAMMYGKNKQTLFAAAKRQIKTAPLPSSTMSTEFVEFCKQKIEEDIGEDLNNFGYNEAQWFSHLPAQKQKAITPIRTYFRNPEIFNLIYSDKDKAKILDEDYEAIVKAEIQPTDGKPRMVCSIPQRTKYAMGPITWQLEELCAKKLRGYCGGKNLTQMAEDINYYYNQGFTKVVEGDGSAFDNSQDVTLKAIDRYIYDRVLEKVYHVPKNEFFRQSHKYYKTMNVKYTDNDKKITYLRYKVLGTVFSGDADTTLANTIRMAMYNRFTNEQAGLRYGIDYVCFSKGDDFTVLYKPYVSDAFIDNAYKTHFLPKPEGKYDLCDTRIQFLGQICKFLDKGGPTSLKFCSLRAWYKNPFSDEITLTRDPSKLFSLSQYAIKTKTYRPAQRVAYHLSQAMAYEASYQGIEIFDIMRLSHLYEALKIYEVYKNQKKFQMVFHKEYDRLLKQKQREENYDFGCGDKMNKKLADIYELQNRDQVEDLIYSDYWANMQMRYNIRTEINSKEELKYINDQINAEFDTEELKSQLGLLGKIKFLSEINYEYFKIYQNNQKEEPSQKGPH
jgi:hypothetical protein